MANVFGGGDAQFSMRPPRAPLPAMLGRRARGRLGNQAHLGGAAKLRPNHPIMQLARRRMAAAAPADPAAQYGGMEGETDPALMAEYQQRGLLASQQQGPQGPAAPTEQMPEGYDPALWEDYKQRGMLASQQQGTDPVRERLMRRYHTASPQQPALTSRRAMNHFLGNRRRVQQRPPMLPQRRRPY